jgi:acetyl esterase
MDSPTGTPEPRTDIVESAAPRSNGTDPAAARVVAPTGVTSAANGAAPASTQAGPVPARVAAKSASERTRPRAKTSSGSPAGGARKPSTASGAGSRARSERPKSAAGSGAANGSAPGKARTTKAAASAPEEDRSGPAGSWRGRSRSRALYNRRIQRADEQWPLGSQSLARAFRHPEVMLAAMGERAPIERDGRVLNRSIQAMIQLADRFGGITDGPPDADGPPDVATLRTQLRRKAKAVMPIRTDVHVSGRLIPGPEGAPEIPVRIYRQYGSGLGAGPDGRASLPAIVYFHGGGWVVGDLESHDASCRMLAAVSHCLVVAVDYRLAPEDPYPAAVEDALAAYRWVHGHHQELGISPGQVGVMGDSAGGNLAAVVAQELRTAAAGSGPEVPPPVAQGLVYPALDARLDSPSMDSMGSGLFLTRANMEYYRRQYLPQPSDWEAPKASPLLAPDVSGLAPALIVTAGFDPLREDGSRYAEKLRQAGVEVEYRCYDDQIHGFMGMGILADSLALATEVCDAMGHMMRQAASTEPAG